MDNQNSFTSENTNCLGVRDLTKTLDKTASSVSHRAPQVYEITASYS